MLLDDYMKVLKGSVKDYEDKNHTEDYPQPLAITTDFNQYRYAMIVILTVYIGKYVAGEWDIEDIDENTFEIQWADDHYTGSGKFDNVRQEFVKLVMEIMSDDESVYLPSLAWSNHIEHTGGYLLNDHGNYAALSADDIDTISQASLSEVFPDIFG